MFRLALLQFDPVFAQVEANLDTVEDMIQGLECDLLLLPELFATGYWFETAEQVAALSEERGGRTAARVRSWAAQLDAAVAYGYCERDGERFFNSASIVTSDAELMHYRKLHRFAEEKRWFEPGDGDLEVIEYRGVRLGMMICFDWRFPETARTLAFRGADLILHPSNLVLPWCPDAMITRALENNVFIATADRSGDDHHGDDRLHFIGQTQVVAPDGHRLGQLPETGSGILQVELDPAKARDKAISEFNDLFGDLRPEFYAAPGAPGI